MDAPLALCLVRALSASLHLSVQHLLFGTERKLMQPHRILTRTVVCCIVSFAALASRLLALFLDWSLSLLTPTILAQFSDFSVAVPFRPIPSALVRARI